MKLKSVRPYATAVLASLFVGLISGCQPALVRTDTFLMPSPIHLRVMSYDASRRGVFIMRVKNPAGEVNTVVCPEPPPDVAVQYASVLSGAISASAKANGGIINPLASVTSAVGAVNPNNLKDMLSNLAKGGDQIPSIRALSNTDLVNAAASANVTASGSISTSMTPTELHSAQTIELLRNSEFWACINQANGGVYNSEIFSKHQALVESAVASEILAQNSAELRRLNVSLHVPKLSKEQKETIKGQIDQLNKRQSLLEQYNGKVLNQLK